MCGSRVTCSRPVGLLAKAYAVASRRRRQGQQEQGPSFRNDDDDQKKNTISEFDERWNLGERGEIEREGESVCVCASEKERADIGVGERKTETTIIR